MRGNDAGHLSAPKRGTRAPALPMALFVPIAGPVMSAPGESWTVEQAEKLLRSLTGVVSVRIVRGVAGDIEEIHLLTTEQIGPKQTVRNVESALLAHLDLVVDHRRISVAQSNDHDDIGPGGGTGTHNRVAQALKEGRILFLSHMAEPERIHRVRYQVQVEWDGKRFTGDAAGADVPRTRLETVAHATLRGVEAAVAAARDEAESMVTLELDGVRVVEAFERAYALVAVHAIGGREIMRLSGAAIVDASPDRAVIMATLQATDRWVRGRLRDTK